MKKLGMSLIGPGFVAAHHLDAFRRLGDVDMFAIAGSSQESAEKKAQAYRVDRAYRDYKTLTADPDVQVIHNTMRMRDADGGMMRLRPKWRMSRRSTIAVIRSYSKLCVCSAMMVFSRWSMKTAFSRRKKGLYVQHIF